MKTTGVEKEEPEEGIRTRKQPTWEKKSRKKEEERRTANTVCTTKIYGEEEARGSGVAYNSRGEAVFWSDGRDMDMDRESNAPSGR